MKKIFLFLSAALLSLAVSATEYDVVISDANIDIQKNNDIDITSQLGGALLTDGDVVNLTVKGYFSVAIKDVMYAGIVDNSEAAGYWKELSEMDYNSGISIGAGDVAEGTECNATIQIPIIADAVTSEKIVVRLMLKLAAKVQNAVIKSGEPVKLRATLEELSVVAAQYIVEMPTGEFQPDSPKQFKYEIDFETEEVLKKDDILNLTINGTFSADIYNITVMVFEGAETMLPWTEKTFSATKDSEVTDVTISIPMVTNFSGKTGKLTVFAVYDPDGGEVVPEGISFLKAGEEVHEGIELGSKSYETVSLDYNQYATPHNYQFIDAAIATNVMPNDYVTFSITGVTNKAFEGELKVYLRDGVEGGSYGAVSGYTTIAQKVDAQGEITFEGILKVTKVAEICDLVMEISDEAEEGASIVIAPAGTQVHEGVELTSKEFTTLTLAANVWDEGSNYQYVEELTAPEEGFLKGDFVSLSINGVASNDIAKLQVALIGSEYNNVSDYVTIAENVKAGDAITFSKKLVLNSATDVCNLTITTTDAVADDIEAITIEGGDLPHVAVELAQKEFTSLTLAANDWGTGSNYQSEAVEIEKPEAGFFEGDYVSFTIKGVADNAITTLQVVLVDDSWSAVSEYTPVTTEAIEKDGSVDITGKVELTKATEVCKLVFNTTDAVVEGVETIKIVSADGPVHVAVELAQKDFTSLTMVANVWDAGSNYQYVEELTAPEEGFQEGDYVTVTITGVASHNIEGLQVALIDGSWNAVSAYTSLATGINAGEEVSITKAIPLTKATDVCKLTITTTDPAADGVAEIKIEPKEVAVEEVAASAFAVEGGMVYSAGEIVVYNVAGKQVASASKAFNVNSLAAGVYFITAQEGTIKFVK